MKIEEKIEQISKLASGVDHVSGLLVDHLKGTYKLLQDWGSEEFLCMAGLFHAVYGTSEFNQVLISEEQRGQVRELIGEQSEKIVYTYCACDRDFFWQQIGVNANPLFVDRFTGSKYHLSLNELTWFCELTVANELEIARRDADFIQQRGHTLSELFLRMKPYISVEARNFAVEILKQSNSS